MLQHAGVAQLPLCRDTRAGCVLHMQLSGRACQQWQRAGSETAGHPGERWHSFSERSCVVLAQSCAAHLPPEVQRQEARLLCCRRCLGIWLAPLQLLRRGSNLGISFINRSSYDQRKVAELKLKSLVEAAHAVHMQQWAPKLAPTEMCCARGNTMSAESEQVG